MENEGEYGAHEAREKYAAITMQAIKSVEQEDWVLNTKRCKGVCIYDIAPKKERT